MKKPILVASDIHKSFGSTSVLSGTTLEVRPGEVVGLIGENGAGKSTLLNILSGVIKQDSGTLTLNGDDVELSSAREAILRGIFRTHQEPALNHNLRVYQAMLLGLEARFEGWGPTRDSRMREYVISQFADFGINVPVASKVSTLDIATRQLLEVCRAAIGARLTEARHPVILLDEPTASMGGDDVERLLRIITGSKGDLAFVFVSHRLHELLTVCDRVYVMKDGAVVLEDRPAALTEAEIHRQMVGRERPEVYYLETDQREPAMQVLLSVNDITFEGEFEHVSFEVRAGEILGIGGVVASGKSTLGRVIAGVQGASSGTLALSGKTLRRGKSVRGHISMGIGYVPPDRHAEGLLLEVPVSRNITLNSVRQISNRFGFVSRRAEEAVAVQRTATFGVTGGNAKTRTGSLSGGNQQKVLLAKTMEASPVVVVLDNPTRGVDVGAKHSIYGYIRQFAAAGLGIVLVSDDLPELIGLSNRILILCDGHVAGFVNAPGDQKPLEQDIIPLMLAHHSRMRGPDDKSAD